MKINPDLFTCSEFSKLSTIFLGIGKLVYYSGVETYSHDYTFTVNDGSFQGNILSPILLCSQQMIKNFSISVVDVNEAPIQSVFLDTGGQQSFNPNHPTINENTNTGVVIGSVQATDSVRHNVMLCRTLCVCIILRRYSFTI